MVDKDEYIAVLGDILHQFMEFKKAELAVLNCGVSVNISLRDSTLNIRRIVME